MARTDFGAAVMIIVLIILVCAILCNIAGLYLLVTLDKRTPQILILMNLSTIDTSLAFCWFIFLTGNREMKNVLEIASKGLYVIWYGTIYLLTLDRFVGIIFPIKHKVFVKNRFIMHTIAGFWSVGALLSLVTAFTNPTSILLAFKRYVYTIMDLFFLGLLLISYTSILIRLARRRANNKHQGRQAGHKFFATVSTILAAFLLFETIPSLLETFLEEKNSAFESIRTLLYTINLLSDPLVYTLMQPRVRGALHGKINACINRTGKGMQRNQDNEMMAMRNGENAEQRV